MRLACDALTTALLLASLGACGDDGAGSDDTTSATTGAGVTSTAAATGTSTGSGTGGGNTGGSGGGGPMNNGFPAAWPNGTSCASEDPIFVWEFADDTFILRQSLCTSFEGPFLYLLFGENRAILLDTGDGGIPLQATVQGIVDAWLARNQKTSIELVVMHSHAHGDHVAGDGQFQNAPNAQVVGLSVSSVSSFFGITGWPMQSVTYDLGGRVLDIVPIPGHQSAHVAVYDPRHQLLLTGDTLYPGRLYISDYPAYGTSVGRLVDFVNAGHPVTWVLGGHIEMTTTPGQDFPFGADQHPNEHPLELTQAHLFELDMAVDAMMGTASYEVHDDFIVYPL